MGVMEGAWRVFGTSEGIYTDCRSLGYGGGAWGGGALRLLRLLGV